MARRKYVKENNLVKAINTDSLELQKPLVNEYYDINVHNSNMDKIDRAIQEVKGKVDGLELTAQRVSIADSTNKFEATNVEDALLENKTSILNNANLINTNKSNISNIIEESVIARKSVIEGGQNLNDYHQNGIYKIQKTSLGLPLNMPPNSKSYGILIVFNPLVGGNEDRKVQIYVPDVSTTSELGLYFRSYNTSWRKWVSCATTQMTASLERQMSELEIQVMEKGI